MSWDLDSDAEEGDAKRALCNRALQKLGAPPIDFKATSGAIERTVSACAEDVYEEACLSMRWKHVVKTEPLNKREEGPSVDGYEYRYSTPAGFLRIANPIRDGRLILVKGEVLHAKIEYKQLECFILPSLAECPSSFKSYVACEIGAAVAWFVTQSERIVLLVTQERDRALDKAVREDGWLQTEKPVILMGHVNPEEDWAP